MKESYHKWYSQWISEDFEMLVFGDAGIPLVLFPKSKSRYYDYKDFGVIESIRNYVEDGLIKVYCPDSYAFKSWLNFTIEPSERVERYLNFEQAILHDIVGFANYETEEPKIIFGGFGLGGYFALNIMLKYPDISKGVLSISGEFEVKNFIQDHFDEKAYFNSPLDYFFGLTDEKYLKRYKENTIILSSGTPDNSFEQNKYISKLLFEKNVNHLFDVYPFKLNTFDDCKLVLNNNLHYFLNDH